MMLHRHTSSTMTLLRLIYQLLLRAMRFLVPLVLLYDSFSVRKSWPLDITDVSRRTTNDHVLFHVPPCYHQDDDTVQSLCGRGKYRYHDDHCTRNYNWWISIFSVASAFSPPAQSHHDVLLNHNQNLNRSSKSVKELAAMSYSDGPRNRPRKRVDHTSSSAVRLLAYPQSQQPEEAADWRQYYPVVDGSTCNQVVDGNGSTSNQQQQQEQEQDERIEQEQIEREKLNYLALAKEAHSKFFVDQISQEEYVRLALMAWNDAYGEKSDGDDDDVQSSLIRQQRDDNGQLFETLQSKSVSPLKGTSNNVGLGQGTSSSNNGGSFVSNSSSSSREVDESETFLSKSSSSLSSSFSPPLKGAASSANKSSSLSKVPSLAPKQQQQQPLSQRRENDSKMNKDKGNKSSSSSNNPFEVFEGLGAKLFGKSKQRPTPSTSLIGGLGLLNNEYIDEESSIPYGLRVGTGKKGGSTSSSSGNGIVEKGANSDVGGTSASFGGVRGGVNKVGKGFMPSPSPVVSKQQLQQQQMKKREKLKGATSVSGTAADIIGKSAVKQTTKKLVSKGGQFQQSLTAFNTTPNPVTFKKGLVGNNKIGKGVLPTKKMMPISTKKMSKFVTKAPLQQPPSTVAISNETNSEKVQPPPLSPSSSVLKSIDKNKEEIARTKSWIEDEKRLGDVRMKVAEIQGGTAVPISNDTTNPPLQFGVKAREGEVSATREEGSESVWSLLPDEPSVLAASDVVKGDVEEAKNEVAEEEEASSIQDVSSAVNVEPIVAAESSDAIGNGSHEDWVQEQNRLAQERAAARIAQDLATKKIDEVPTIIQEAAAIGKLEEEDTTNVLPEDWIQEQNRLAQQRTAERVAKEKERQTEAAAAAAAMEQEERRLKARAEAEAKIQSNRLKTLEQSNVVNKRKMTEMEKPRSEQIPNGEYWLAEQNRVVEERQKAGVVATGATAGGVPLKGSDEAAIRLEQPIVSPKIMSTPKRFEVANTGKGMSLKVDSLKGNKPLRPDVQQQPNVPVRSYVQQQPNVEPVVSSPRSDGLRIPTTLRGSNESRMIEKGFVPFTGPTSTQELNSRSNSASNPPQNAQQVVAPAIPINKIDPSVASELMVPMIQKKESGRRSLDLAEAEAWAGSLDDIDVSSLPIIRVGNRIRSSLYGTTHQVLLFLPKDDGGYEILPCVAKRPWTMAELYANVPSKVSAFEEQQSESAFDELISPESWEVDYKAKAVRRYWEVEIHCNKKFQQKKELYDRLQMQALYDKKQKEENGDDSDGADDGVSFATRVAEVATPKFYDVYPDDGSGGTNEDDIIPEYGLFGQDVWNKTIEFGHDWLVYESKIEVNELTLLDAMMMQHEINKQFLEDGYQVHHLYGIQQAMKLPDSFGFGDVLDVIFRSLLENIAFLASCNVVHRKLNPSNVICDEDNGRLRIINFGDAVDLDPKETVRVGLDNDTLESNAPGAIANSLAADIFSVALLVCELLFDFDEATFTAQIKEVGYDLDAWLQRTLTADERPLGLDEALWYLSERRGLWALLKSMIKPNPLRRKITSASMKQFNEIIALKEGKIEETDQILAGGNESFLNSILFPSGSDSSLPGNANISSATKAQAANIDDIPQTQYTSSLPRASLSSSILSELAEQMNEAADEERNQSTREEGPNSNPKMQNPAHTASSSNSDTYNDITRASFTPARTSKLTAMLAPKSRDPVTQKQLSFPEQQSGNYYDITRASFQRVSPQPMALTASQLYALLRESGAAGIPPQLDYDLTQSGYIPETNIGESDYIGKNIVLPQRAVSANLPRGYVPARPTESISQEAYEEVEQWLVSRLPRLQKADVSNYCWSLIDDGFDSAEMLEEIEFDDLHFMKKAHQRALAKALSQEINPVPEKAVFQSNDQSSPKKVYKVEEALGEAARKGIEALVAASKTDNQQKPDGRKQMLERFKAYEAKVAAEKAETERKIAEVEKRLQAERSAKVAEERELKALQDRIEAELQAKAQKEQRLKELEKDVASRAKAEDERELKKFQERIETELQIKAEEDHQSNEQGKEMEKEVTEHDTDTNWIEEQNRLAEERNLARLAREKDFKLGQNELKGSSGSIVKKSRLANLIEKAENDSELSFEEGMTEDEAEMVRKTRD